MIHTQFQKRIKMFRSDGGKESLLSSMSTLLKSHGTIHQQSCPYTHQQNGTAERKHKHLLEVAKSLLIHMNVLKNYWAEAVMVAAVLINITPSSVTNDTCPYTRIHGYPFKYLALRTFGCVCFVLLPFRERDKLFPKATNVYLLGTTSLIKDTNAMIPSLIMSPSWKTFHISNCHHPLLIFHFSYHIQKALHQLFLHIPHHHPSPMFLTITVQHPYYLLL